MLLHHPQFFSKVLVHLPYQGSYKKLQPFFQDFSRTKLNFQGPPTRNVISHMVYKYTFPVQANRFLRLQVFSPSPSLHFSVHLPLLVISSFYTRVLQCLKNFALHRKGIPKSMQSNLLSTPLHLKLKKIQGLFKDLNRNSRTSRKNRIQGLFKDSP